MIETSKITQYIENALNSRLNALNNEFFSNTEFKLFTDTGVFAEDIVDKSRNSVTEYINGLVTALPSERFFLSDGLEVCTLPLRLEVTFPLEGEYDNRGVETVNIETGEIEVTQAVIGDGQKVETIRTVIDSAFTNEQLITTLKDNDNVEYATSVISQIATGEMRKYDGIIGYNYTFIVTFSFSFFENGLNSRQGKFYLDGVELPFTSFDMVRVKNVDNNILTTQQGLSKVFPLFTGLTINIELPALNNSDITSTALSFLRGNERLNTTHILSVSLDGKQTDYYLVTFIENGASVSGVKNVGLRISFAEVVNNYEFLHFGRTFYIYKVLQTSYNVTLKGLYALFNKDYTFAGIQQNGIIANLTEGLIIVSTQQQDNTNNNLELL